MLNTENLQLNDRTYGELSQIIGTLQIADDSTGIGRYSPHVRTIQSLQIAGSQGAFHLGGTGYWANMTYGLQTYATYDGRPDGLTAAVARFGDGRVTGLGLWLDGAEITGKARVTYPDNLYRTPIADVHLSNTAWGGQPSGAVDGLTIRFGKRGAVQLIGHELDVVLGGRALVDPEYHYRPISFKYDDPDLVLAILRAQKKLGVPLSLKEYDLLKGWIIDGLNPENVESALWYLMKTGKRGDFSNDGWQTIRQLMEVERDQGVGLWSDLLPKPLIREVGKQHFSYELSPLRLTPYKNKIKNDKAVHQIWGRILIHVGEVWDHTSFDSAGNVSHAVGKWDKLRFLHFLRTHFSPEILYLPPLPSMKRALKVIVPSLATIIPALLLTLGVAFLSSSAWAGENASTEVEPSNWQEEAGSFAKSYILGEALSRLGPLGVAASFLV